jgi:hypothetical protein
VEGEEPTPESQRVPDGLGGPDGPSPAERLVARASATDRGTRFEERLGEVQRIRARRRRVRHVVRVGWVVVLAAVGALAVLVAAAVVGSPAPTGGDLLTGAIVGGVLGAVGPVGRDWLARRRGARAWDAYHERYVLLGDPSTEVRDADRPSPAHGGPPRPTRPSDRH